MTTKGNNVFRTYDRSFVLEPQKLNRVLAIIEERFAGRDQKLSIRLDIQLLDGRKILLHDMQDVFALDNTVGNPITKLALQAEPGASDALEVCSIYYGNSFSANIRLEVTGADAKWANQLFAEIEEQLERTFLNEAMYKMIHAPKEKYLNILLLLGMISVGIFMIWFVFSSTLFRSRTPGADYEMLADKASQATTTEEKVDVIFEMSKIDIERRLPPKPPARQSGSLWSRLLRYINLQSIFLALPIVIVLVCLIYLVKNCYPHATFAWGDCGEHHERLIIRRRNLWIAVVAALFFGIISNLFVLSVSELI